MVKVESTRRIEAMVIASNDLDRVPFDNNQVGDFNVAIINEMIQFESEEEKQEHQVFIKCSRRPDDMTVEDVEENPLFEYSFVSEKVGALIDVMIKVIVKNDRLYIDDMYIHILED